MQHTSSSVSQSSANNAVSHMNLVSSLAKEADRDLQQFHKLIELYRQEIQSMNRKVTNLNDELHQSFVPLIENLYHQLQSGMAQQQQQNSNFQTQLTELKKEKSLLSQMINASNKRNQLLSGEIGNY